MLHNNGHNVPVLEKLEINQTADHAGLSELLNPSLTESALLTIKLKTQEFLKKIYSHAVVSGAVKDATEDIHQVPGHGGKILVLSLEIYTTSILGVNHMLSLHVIIMLMVLYHHALEPKRPQLVKRNAFPNTLLTNMPKINTLVLHLTVFMEFKKSNKKFIQMDPLKLLSLFMKIS